MTESTLSITYADLKLAVAHYLGMSLTPADWSADEIVQIDMAIKGGLRKFYKPQQVSDNEPPHRWSFLHPITTLTTAASYTTGTIALDNNEEIVTLTGGAFPSWAGSSGYLVIDNVTYALSSQLDSTHVELASVWTGDTVAAKTYELRHNGIYALPDNFAGIASRTLTHAEGVFKPDVKLVSDAQIRQLQAIGHTGRSDPQYCAIRPKDTTVSSAAGQRFEMLFYPIPDAAYVLSYEMVVQADMISDTYPYPLGGAAHGQTIIASCLSVAELTETGSIGDQETNYIKLLKSSIREDQGAYQSEHFGYNGDNSDNVHNPQEVRRLSGLVTYEPSE